MSVPDKHPNLILFNARVITLNEGQPIAEAVAVRGDKIAWVGSNIELDSQTKKNVAVIDCQGQTLVPGFIDAHCHILAYASSLLAVDCSPAAVASIAEIQQALRDRAYHTPKGQWIRAVGYDEFALKERRHPSRWDLDRTVPDHPVRLNHRSGHACVLNSVALDRVGISINTPDPQAGAIERAWDSGEPNGFLMDMDDYLEGRIPPLSNDEFRRGVQAANHRFLSYGITSVADATHTNSTKRWNTFRMLKNEGALSPRVVMMVGNEHMDDFTHRDLWSGSGDEGLNLGPVKIMLTMTVGKLAPSPVELREAVSRAHEAGFPVAIHAVEAEAVEAACDALIEAQTAHPSSQTILRDRIEHCSECPPSLLGKVARSRAAIVTQPGFIYHSGRRYLSDVDKHMRPWLYRTNSFQSAGLTVVASSDAPVTDPNPLIGMYAAVARRASTGEIVGEPERVSPMEALRMYTLNGAYSLSQEQDKGSIEPGKFADLTLLDEDPTDVECERISHIKATKTIVGGKVVWEA